VEVLGARLVTPCARALVGGSGRQTLAPKPTLARIFAVRSTRRQHVCGHAALAQAQGAMKPLKDAVVKRRLPPRAKHLRPRLTCAPTRLQLNKIDFSKSSRCARKKTHKAFGEIPC